MLTWQETTLSDTPGDKFMMAQIELLSICSLALAVGLPAPAKAPAPTAAPHAIDRQALVTRHIPVLHKFDPETPFTVGNGEFAFTADCTGLQTFPESFENTTPLGTLSQWGWHTSPNTNGWSIDTFHFTEFDSHRRKVGYADVPHNERTPEINWLRSNPHRLHLGRLGLIIRLADGRAAQPTDLAGINQSLDLWNGELVSKFSIENSPIEVRTICHPDRDLLAVCVSSPLLSSNRLSLLLSFPYGTGATTTADWTHPDRHQTSILRLSQNSALFTRRLDADYYLVAARWSENASLAETNAHHYLIDLSKGSRETNLEFVCAFSPKPETTKLPSFDETRRAASAHWNGFWTTGGAIDLSESQDPRWHELERRIVLSQYLTAIQCSGSLPPQETGLTYNSWEGKFHLEMHWWHAAHFALWNRLPMLEKSLGYYSSILRRAQATAKRQGYFGARWPKMTDPSGAESPSSVGPFLIWQQPHPIFYAELCYRQHTNRETLQRFSEIVSQTAEFMASYAFWDGSGKRYVLGPPLQCAQERFPKDKTINPTFELTYWRWGLETAQCWRERLCQPRLEKWDHVLQHLATPVTEDGKYLFAETAPGTYTEHKWTDDHPSVLASLGVLPPIGDPSPVTPDIMRPTLHWIWDNWNWPDTWGWDYPMVAMCAARLGEPERAIDALLRDTPKNHYGLNGHNYQRPGLSIYLPGNGGLLYATAMMAAGWDGSSQPTPGFPTNGQWKVRCENLSPAP
jgi:hypothetical protein